MRARRDIVALALCVAAMAGAIEGARAAAPATLDCVETHGLNWRIETPELVASSDEDELGSTTVHLDPATGEWFLSVAGSAALTQGGGTFEVKSPSEFAAYHHEWVGIDGDTVLRIWGGGDAPLRFVLLSGRAGLVMGACAEPAEPFIFLQPVGKP